MNPSRSRRVAAALLSALLLVTGFVVTSPAAPAGAQQSPTDTEATTMSFNGRGWGHGRGMSQYGAQGYASQHGWTYRQILDHYYGGTRAGSIAEAGGVGIGDVEKVRIRLMAQDAKPTVVAIDAGTFGLQGTNGFKATGVEAVRLTKQSDGTLYAEHASSCSGPWSKLSAGGTGTAHVSIVRESGAQPLRLCRDDGVHVWYPGELHAVVHEDVQRTVNVTSLESQLRSTVPRESPASWHAEALKAQSVAARSYAAAGDSRHQPYADTCDTTLCQVYQGWFKQDPGGSKEPTTDPRTDEAIRATAGEVRVFSSGARSGQVARTEFSSTSGGWTAGGTFPAVEDRGDAISPRHTWSRTVDMSRLEQQYGKGGQLVEVRVLERNGLGPMGGRVLQARLVFSNDVTADVTGNTVRSLTGLYSDWFTPVCGAEVRYVHAVYELFLGRVATGTESEARCAQVRRGERFDLTRDLAVSDEWAGRQIDALYRKVLGRASDASGRAYWLAQVDRGLRVEDIAAQFYGSAEYYQRVGRSAGGFVDALYRDLMGRQSDADGRAHWAGRLQRGELSRTQVAGSFYSSLESRRDRVDALYEQVLDRGPDASGRKYWVDRLLTLGDVALAAHLAASDEYYQRSLTV